MCYNIVIIIIIDIVTIEIFSLRFMNSNWTRTCHWYINANCKSCYYLKIVLEALRFFPTINFATSLSLSHAHSETLNLEMEPDVSIETSSMIRAAVLPIGTIPTSLFRDYASMLNRHQTVSLSSISSFYTEHQKSPFAHQPWDSGSLRFKFILGGSPPSPWEDFQSNRKILAVIGICHCPSSPDLGSVALQFSNACKGYSSSLVQRCFAFCPGDSQVRSTTT